MITCFFENNNQAKSGLRHVTVNAIIIDNGKILMGKRGMAHGKAMLEAGKWGLIGGFFDRDETLIQAVHREVFEESGCEISDITLLRINDNPNRPMEDRQNVDIIFVANLTKQTVNQNEEVTHLEWFPLDNIPQKEQIAFDHGDSIALYKKYIKESFPLPLLG